MLYLLILIRILAVVIVSLKMKQMSKSIKTFLAGNINISSHEGHGSQSYHRPIAHTQMKQENNSIYYDLK